MDHLTLFYTAANNWAAGAVIGTFHARTAMSGFFASLAKTISSDTTAD